MQNLVTVLIPTMASRERSDMLKRAVQSVRNSTTGHISIIVIVNGQRFDVDVCTWLKSQSDIQFEYVERPSAPYALLHGRTLVRTEFFSTLDDDDEYVAGATDLKLAAMNISPGIDLVVGNYLQSFHGRRELRYPDMSGIPDDPLMTFFSFNWLSSGNALFRGSSVGEEYFKDPNPFAEWTLLAFRLCLNKKNVAVVSEPVFICHGDTPDSLSKSDAYLNSYVPLFDRMLELAPPRNVARLIRAKRGAGYHDASVIALQHGQRKKAWLNHLRSLFEISGWRYLTYTRHLLKRQ
jgi:hypothetical protein